MDAINRPECKAAAPTPISNPCLIITYLPGAPKPLGHW